MRSSFDIRLKMHKKSLIVICLSIFASCSFYRELHRPSQRELPAEFVERAVTVKGKERRFRVFVPKELDTSQRLPVMLYLHGSGSRGDDNLEPSYGFASATEGVREKMKFIVVLPQCADDAYWSTTEMVTYALASLDHSIEEFNGDESRIYIAGFSLGGYGAIHMGAAFPDKFAAIVPVAGGVGGDIPSSTENTKEVYPLIEEMINTPDPFSTVTKAMGQKPVWVFHGSKDESIPVESSRKIVAALRANKNPNVRYTEFENEGHLIFDKSFAEPGFLDWLLDQKNWRVSYENVQTSDDDVYSSIFEAIVYNEKRPFGLLYGGSRIVFNGQTILASEPVPDSVLQRSSPDLVRDFQNKNKSTAPIRNTDFGVHYPLIWRKPSTDVVDLAKQEFQIDADLAGVVGVSSIGYDSQKTQSLALVEFVDRSMNVTKKYCHIRWKQTSSGTEYSSLTWLD